MFFSTIAARSFGGTGWLALALVASETWSVSQPASTKLAASATETRNARASEREIKMDPTPSKASRANPILKHDPTGDPDPSRRAFSQSRSSAYALKPLIKILTSGSCGRNPNGDHEPVGPKAWSTKT